MDNYASQSNTCNQVTELITLLRPLQSVKSDFVLAPLMFTRAFIDSLCLYFALNISNTFFLNYQPVIDIFLISLGFVRRGHADTGTLDFSLSGWILVTTPCLALYLAGRCAERSGKYPQSLSLFQKL